MVAKILFPAFGAKMGSGCHWYAAPVVDFRERAADPARYARKTMRHLAELSEAVSRDSCESWAHSARTGIVMGSALKASCEAFCEEWARQTEKAFGQFAELFRVPPAIDLLVRRDPSDERVLRVAFANRSLTERAKRELHPERETAPA